MQDFYKILNLKELCIVDIFFKGSLSVIVHGKLAEPDSHRYPGNLSLVNIVEDIVEISRFKNV